MISESPGSVIERTNTEIFSASGSQFIVVSRIMMDTGLGQHGVVFDLRLPERWGIIGNDHQLRLPHSQSFEGLFVAQLEFARFHDKSQSAVDGFNCLLLLLLSSHCVYQRRNSDELLKSQTS